jgi:hypothetical protein
LLLDFLIVASGFGGKVLQNLGKTSGSYIFNAIINEHNETILILEYLLQ